MDIKGLTVKVKDALCKYKYAVVILLIGVGLLLLPKKSTAAPVTNATPVNREQTLETEDLTEILQSVQGQEGRRRVRSSRRGIRWQGPQEASPALVLRGQQSRQCQHPES